MTKKIAVINDLSGFGRCSLTAAISVIAAMGVQPCPLPTAVLSAQTGYDSYFCDDYTHKMDFFRCEWEKMGAKFDGIYTGFIANESQIDHIIEFVDTFRKKDTFLLVDPIMGDNGNAYPFFTETLRERMKELVWKADMIIPNLTELCLLTDSDYSFLNNLQDKLQDEKELIKRIVHMAGKVIEKGTKMVIVTGIRYFEHSSKTEKIGNLVASANQTYFSAFPYVGESYSGTGDLFASVIVAGRARGDSIESSIDLAGRFVERAIVDSVKENVPRNDGVNYEQYLGMLVKKSV